MQRGPVPRISQCQEHSVFMLDQTRQSEMANTSPRHMPVPGNVHPIKIQTFDISSLRHFSVRSRFYILINMAAQEVRSQEKYLKEIVGPVFEIYAIELLGSMSTDEA